MKPDNPLNQNNTLISRLTQIVLDNLQNEQFGVSELANLAGISRSQLHRKFVVLKNQSVSQFIREIRLNEAYKLIIEKNLTASEAAYRVGFNNPSYFNSCFHQYYGFPPGEAVKRNISQKNADGKKSGERELPVISKRSKTTYLLAAILTIALVTSSIFLVKSILFGKEKVKKSIIVLPFVDDSPGRENSYIISGLMEEVLNKLSVISDLNVVSRTTSEKYRDSKKSIKEIGKEQNVDYVLEGSAQTINNMIRIRLQLIETNTDRHLWSKPYEREVTLENIFKIQEELANLIAEELDAVLTPKQKKQIRKKPTTNLAAYNKYLWGLDYLRLYEQRPIRTSREDLPKAKQLFEQAIELDSTFVAAYVQLADIYLNKYRSWGNIYGLDPLYLDSCLTMVNKALAYDRKNVEAMAIKGQCYLREGKYDEARIIFEDLPKNKPEIREYYKAAFDYFFLKDNAYNTIRNFLKYEELTPPGTFINPELYYKITWHFTYAGYPEIAARYAEKILQLNNDSVAYYNLMNLVQIMSGNYIAAEEFGLKTLRKDSLNTEALYYMMMSSIWMQDYKNAYKYLTKYGGLYINGQSAMMVYFVYLKNGMNEEADQHFRAAVKILNDEIDMNTMAGNTFYSQAFLACVYATKGDKEKAIEYLSYEKERETIHLYLVISMKEWPMLENIRYEPEFESILTDMESKYKREHELVGELLKEKGILE